MSDVDVVRSHHLTLEQAKTVAQQSADELASEYDLVSEWHGDTLHFHRSGVDGRMKVSEGEIAISLKLGFLLRPFRGKFEENIGRNLEARLAEATASAKAGHAAKAAPRTTATKTAGRKKGGKAGS